MAEPGTLMQMTGAPGTPLPLAVSAVVMIDAQNEYLSGGLPLAGIDRALDEGARLLAAARAAGRPVIHVQHKGRPDGLFDPETAGFAIAAPVAPLTGETVVTKGLPNAFAGTDLDDVLKTLEISSLVVDVAADLSA